MPTSSSFDRRAITKIFQDESSFGTALFLGAVGLHGPEMFQWSPEGILSITEQELGIKIPQGCFDRLMGAITIYTTDMFWQDLPSFCAISNVMAGAPLAEDFDPPSVLEMTWTVTESGLLALDHGEKHEFSNEIKYYIMASCQEEGILTPPPILAAITADQIPVEGSDFSQEPDLYEAVWYNQRTAVLDIQIAVQSNLWKLYEQLKQLGHPEAVQKKLTEMQNSVSVSLQALRKQEADLLAR